jgi:glutathione S-transferase
VAAGFTGPVFSSLVRTRAQDRDEKALRVAIAAHVAKLRIAEARLERHPFLVGEDFTLADIQFGHLLYRYFTVAIERPELPALQRYYDRLTARPAYREHVMVSYEELRAPA